MCIIVKFVNEANYDDCTKWEKSICRIEICNKHIYSCIDNIFFIDKQILFLSKTLKKPISIICNNLGFNEYICAYNKKKTVKKQSTDWIKVCLNFVHFDQIIQQEQLFCKYKSNNFTTILSHTHYSKLSQLIFELHFLYF